MKILLDTCTLWIAQDSPSLSTFRPPDIYRSGPGGLFQFRFRVGNQCEVSLGGLPLPEAPEVFVPRQRILHSIDFLPLAEAEALYGPNLPQLHKDPFDRSNVSSYCWGNDDTDARSLNQAISCIDNVVSDSAAFLGVSTKRQWGIIKEPGNQPRP